MVSLEDYEELRTELNSAQTELNQLKDHAAELERQKEDYQEQLELAQAQVSALEGEFAGLKEQYELLGDTPAETAANVVRYYYQTHTYTKVDFYVCSDMSLDVWNMLETLGINSVIQIGDVDVGVTKITECNHAWVLAEVAPGQYLALETTGGFVVTMDENELYYRGWSFNTPKDFKRYSELRSEYNIRVEVINQHAATAGEVAADYQEAIDEYNKLVEEFNKRYAGRPVSTESRLLETEIECQLALVEAKESHYDSLKEIIAGQELALENIMVEVEKIALERVY
jgi:hypothetical protein